MAEEEYLIQELRKIEARKKEREKRTQDLQKLITAADTTTEQRRAERKAPKKKLPQKKETEKPVKHLVLVVLSLPVALMLPIPFLGQCLPARAWAVGKGGLMILAYVSFLCAPSLQLLGHQSSREVWVKLEGTQIPALQRKQTAHISPLPFAKSKKFSDHWRHS